MFESNSDDEFKHTLYAMACSSEPGGRRAVVALAGLSLGAFVVTLETLPIGLLQPVALGSGGGRRHDRLACHLVCGHRDRQWVPLTYLLRDAPRRRVMTALLLAGVAGTGRFGTRAEVCAAGRGQDGVRAGAGRVLVDGRAHRRRAVPGAATGPRHRHGVRGKLARRDHRASGGDLARPARRVARVSRARCDRAGRRLDRARRAAPARPCTIQKCRAMERFCVGVAQVLRAGRCAGRGTDDDLVAVNELPGGDAIACAAPVRRSPGERETHTLLVDVVVASVGLVRPGSSSRGWPGPGAVRDAGNVLGDSDADHLGPATEVGKRPGQRGGSGRRGWARRRRTGRRGR